MYWCLLEYLVVVLASGERLTKPRLMQPGNIRAKLSVMNPAKACCQATSALISFCLVHSSVEHVAIELRLGA